MRYMFMMAVLALLMAACSGEKVQSHHEIEPPKITVNKLISEHNWLNTDSVNAVLDLVSEAQKLEGRRLFLQGLDYLVNKKNALASIELFKESICYYPEAKSYFYLTNALMETQNFSDAELAINLAMTLGFEPYYEMDFAWAKMAALKGDTAAALGSLEEAFMNGFLNKERLENEKAFDILRNTTTYESLIVSNFKDEATLQKKLFAAFLKSIPEEKFPFVLEKDSVRAFNYEHYINYDFATFIPGMEGSRFSRDVTNEYMYVSRFPVNDHITGVIYKSIVAIADTLNPVETHLATYDTTGTLIEEQIIACFCSPLTIKTGAVEKDNSLRIREYAVQWKDNPLEKGYAGNKVVSETINNDERLKINNDGHFMKIGEDQVQK